MQTGSAGDSPVRSRPCGTPPCPAQALDSSCQRLLYQPDEVAVGNAGDVAVAVSAGFQQIRNACEVRDGLDVGRRLFASECAVEIRADAAVASIAGDLANTI